MATMALQNGDPHEAARQHTNTFDFIRLFAAGLVVWSHQHALMGLPEPVVEVFQNSFGGVGVLIFFAISGYLNTLSVVRHKSMLTFLMAGPSNLSGIRGLRSIHSHIRSVCCSEY